MSNIIAKAEALTRKQTINICVRAGSGTFIVGCLAGILLIHFGVIG